MRIALAGIVLIAVIPPSVVAAQATRPTDLTVDQVLEEIDRSRQRVSNISYTFESEYEYKDGDVVSKSRTRMTAFRDGERFRAEWQQVTKDKEEQCRGILLTDGYCAVFSRENPPLYEWIYEKSLPKSAEELIAIHSGNDLLDWGFGAGQLTLRELRDTKQAKNVLMLQKPAADRFIRIDLKTLDHGAQRLVTTFTIDPERGFLITAAKGFDERGGLFGSFEVEVKEIRPGVWLPMRVDSWHKDFARREYKLRVLDVSIGTVKPDEFALHKMQPREGMRVMHFYPDGRSEAYVIRDGESVPD